MTERIFTGARLAGNKFYLSNLNSIDSRVENAMDEIDFGKKNYILSVITAISTGIITLMTIIGLIIAYHALLEYEDTNYVANRTRAEDRDMYIADKIYGNPKLALIYVPPSIFDDQTETFRQYVKDRLPNVDEEADVILSSINFHTVEEFNCAIWQGRLNSLAFDTLVIHYMFAEYHITTLYDVWITFDKSTDRERAVIENYSGYLNEIGTDFFFLSALYETARHGYHEPQFYYWIKSNIMKKNMGSVDFYSDYFPTLSKKEDWDKIVRSRGADAEACSQ